MVDLGTLEFLEGGELHSSPLLYPKRWDNGAINLIFSRQVALGFYLNGHIKGHDWTFLLAAAVILLFL